MTLISEEVIKTDVQAIIGCKLKFADLGEILCDMVCKMSIHDRDSCSELYASIVHKAE